MNLFSDTPLIAGLRYAENVISKSEEEALIRHLETLDLTPFRFHAWTGNRKTKSFGWRYDFEDASFAPAAPMPEWLDCVRKCAAAFAELKAEDLVHVLVARYDPGAGIGWHRDRDVFESVVGISLASPAILRFRQRLGTGFRRANLPLAERSAYLLTGPSRWDWEHRIIPGESLRFSITFRTLSDKGRQLAADRC